MLKKLLKGLDSTPSTPKIGRIELPDVGEGDVYYISTSETSAIGKDWSSDSEGPSSPRSPLTQWRRPTTPQPDSLKPRRRPSTQQPTSPLSPRRGSSLSQSDGWKAVSRSSTPRPEVKSPCSRPSTPQPGSSGVTERAASPVSAKPARRGILKPASPPKPISLHWQLLPYDRSRSKKLIYFDVAQPAHLIRDHTEMPPIVLKSSDSSRTGTFTFVARALVALYDALTSFRRYTKRSTVYSRLPRRSTTSLRTASLDAKRHSANDAMHRQGFVASNSAKGCVGSIFWKDGQSLWD